MLFWRIVKPAYAGEPLSGEGAARWGSRWSSPGFAVVYAASSRSLAVLEMLVHVKREYIPRDAVLIPLEVPENLIVELSKLPEGWNSFPYRPDVRRVGDLWVEQRTSLAMFVPSAVLPAERNILINPAHRDSTQIRPGEPEPHAFDPRLFGTR